MRFFYTQLPKFQQCQGCSRSVLSGMCPVCTWPGGSPLPLFSVSVHSKQLKVTCFYKFTQVFILKGLIGQICTKIVQVL